MISIVLCTFNRAGTLSEAIDSILAQTYQDWELIIVDDGSTDGTRELLADYTDKRIRSIFLQENFYYCYAANKGIENTSGKYIAFATSDDVWDREKLEKQAAYLEAHEECGAVFSKIYLIDEKGEKFDGEHQAIERLFEQPNKTRAERMKQFLEDGNHLSHPSSVVRKDLLDEIGGYNLLYAQLADMDLWIRVLQKSDIHILQEELVGYRWWSSDHQISGVTEEKQTRHYHEMIQIHKQMIVQMDNGLFREAFGERFRRKDSESALEIAFEKMFLLFDMAEKFPGLQIAGMELAEEILRTKGASDVLWETFGISLKELYRMNGKGGYVTPIDREREKMLEDRVKYLQEESAGFQRDLSIIVNSKWWRWTAPARDFVTKLKGYRHGKN